MIVGFKRHEIRCRIAGNLLGPLNFADLAGTRREESKPTMSAKFGASLAPAGKHFRRRMPRVRVVATTISTWLVPGALAATGSRKPLWGSTAGEAKNRYATMARTADDAAPEPDKPVRHGQMA